MDRTSKATEGHHMQQLGPPFPQGTKWEPAKPRNSFTAEINAYVERHADHAEEPRNERVVEHHPTQQMAASQPDPFQPNK